MEQVNDVMAQAVQLGVLSIPLSTFLEAREFIRRVRGYAVGATSTVTPASDVVTVEVILISMALLSLHPKYFYIQTKFYLKLRTFLKGPRASARSLNNKEMCAASMQRHSEVRQEILQRVPDYAKQGKLPGVAALMAAEEDRCLDSGEAGFALDEVEPEETVRWSQDS
ncbi:hypothetical protein CYMTET_27704 [Cymbomonas tetramitiformis]|uniref:Uncharacterized protein n=1 Tax=Cymbomonas tetramitiformis TaxID=36881 RepID=A0AAE0KWN4_9CHLO|nr:hypothetical protein CYMTET_27704 [Cymbomonas tetramitiformis]